MQSRQNKASKVGRVTLQGVILILQQKDGVSMNWMESITSAVEYMEINITEDISADDVARHVCMSTFYFQKGFSMLCGLTVMEYIRNRRLALAGGELLMTDAKVIDVAMKYGYDSPDSFTKAFTRFHGITPSAVRKDDAMIKSFAPLKLEISLKGGYVMDYKIEEKESFTVLAAAKQFDYENCKEEIPMFWKEHYEKGNGKYVCGMFGINIDEQMGSQNFEYLIADMYDPTKDVPEGLVTRTIPAFTWAVFPCNGPMPTALQDVNKKIFKEWLPALKEYEFAAGYCVEMYDDPSEYPEGNMDENYHSEIWIPIKKK